VNRTHRTVILPLTTLLAVALAGCSGSTEPAASEAGWEPERDVTMVVPFGAGGGSDAFGRVVASAIEDVEPDLVVTVENREGGSGAVGVEYFRSREGDAQTLLAASNYVAVPNSAFEDFSLNQFTPLSIYAEDVNLVVAAADAPYEDCAEMVDAAGSGRIVAGTAGEFTLDGVAQRLMAEAAGGDFDAVVFDSGAEIIAALLGDQVDVGFVNPGEVAGQLESGDLKPLCHLGSEPLPYEAYEDIPTAEDNGLDVSTAQIRATIAPPGITEEQSEYWIDVLERAYETDAVKDFLATNLMIPMLLSGDAFADYVTEQDEVINEVLQ
jgi:putative tricarboxylic transport membrane protein